MKTASEALGPALSRPGMRIIPESDLRSTERISAFLRREIARLQDSGEESEEIRIRIGSGEGDGTPMVERLVTLEMDGEGMVVVEGLLKDPIRLPLKRNLVGPVQLISDEISGTYLQDPF
ncbi:MAG: hypothetical protein ABSF83_04815 [Nitrososphaerales archaeon]|jgi:hypothetical protein